MTRIFSICFVALLSICTAVKAQVLYENTFTDSSEHLSIVGRGECSVHDGVLSSRGAFVTLGDSNWRNYELSFRARAPKEAEQVQIWAGVRTYNRFDRYVVGIKGGLQDDVYLMRTGYMGLDEFMGVRPLRFHPLPGEWYKVRVQVCENRIRVFVGDEKLPYIDVTDPNASLVPNGNVSLGGSWIDTDFDDVVITPLASTCLDGVKDTEFNKQLSAAEKEQKRQTERASYSDVSIDCLYATRTEYPLDGNWLFMPTYELADSAKAVSADTDDVNWHVMSVPNFWNPIRIWLHGETMGTPRGHQPKGVSDTYYQQETDRCEGYTFDYRKTKAAWYRQWVNLPEGVQKKNVALHFDAVSKMAEVYVNGHHVKSHLGMFGEFDADVTDLMHPGRNLIAVKVYRDIEGASVQSREAMENYYSSVRKEVEDNKNDAVANQKIVTDIAHGFYGDNPAGIWQPVKIIITDAVCMGDVFIKPSLSGAEFDITVCNSSKKKRSLTFSVDIRDRQSGEMLYSGILSTKNILLKGEEKVFTCSVDGLKPKLWEPATPNLYDFSFHVTEGKNLLDDITITSGFRTVESRKDGFLYLNNRKYWLRGGNHIPFALCPNDVEVADRFMQLMREGNVNSTRTHTTPWNELWMSAADRNGIAVSFEGTWSWLMINSTPIPDADVLNLWAKEWLEVMKKYRNHPSAFIWTVNNEMKFYDLDADTERAKQKMGIISDVVKRMRKLDPTRPVSFDSNYIQRKAEKRFGNDFLATIDDGDIDDNHGYYNWYDFSVFRFFNGEFQRDFKTPGRPLISQEMSTGYPNAETGHPTRSYQLIHQNPYCLVGYNYYDWNNPAYFLKAQSFITGELAETLRRTGDQCSGIMHFAYMTWFRQCYNAKNIQPYPTYFAMKRAMQPVLVSAELWGRNFYAGESIPTRIYVVNDDEKGRDLSDLSLSWTVTGPQGENLGSGKCAFPDVNYYERRFVDLQLPVSAQLPELKVYAKLNVRLLQNDNVISSNEYDITLAEHAWNKVSINKHIAVLANDNIQEILADNGIASQAISGLDVLNNKKFHTDLLVVSGINICTDSEATALRSFMEKGGHVLFLQSKEVAQKSMPEYIDSWIIPTEGDIVVMERSDDPVFNGLDELDLRYFNNNKREIPLACSATLKVKRHANVRELAGQMKIHAYIDGGKPEDRINKIESMRGVTLVEITVGKGKALVSTLCTEKADTDPIAGHILVNELMRF